MKHFNQVLKTIETMSTQELKTVIETFKRDFLVYLDMPLEKLESMDLEDVKNSIIEVKNISYGENIDNWLDEEKAKVLPYYINCGWSGESLDRVCEDEKKNLDFFVLRLYRAVTNKNKDVLLELYPYFENLSHNRNTAFVFRELTGVKTGVTNKDGVKAFNEFFGMEIENIIKAKQKEEKEQEKREIEKQKQKEQEEIKSYFSNSIWNIDGLTKMQLGRVKKSLEIKYNFSNGIMTLKEHLETGNFISKHSSDNMHKWSSRKANNMTMSEEKEYEEKLKSQRSYFIDKDESHIDIPKIVFDILSLEDVTNRD